MHEYVVTAVGNDRPGLVDRVTGCLLDIGCNVADSRMINLRGQFAMILLAEVPEHASAKVDSALQQAGKDSGLKITVSTKQGEVDGLRAGLPFTVKAYAMDQPGLVHRITHLLHQRSINIEELQTKLEPGSYTGTPLFTLTMRITVPADQQVKQLRAELEHLCDSLNCDFDLDGD